MIAKGFRFGLLLQFAVGPVCLYVLKVAVEAGAFPAFSAVAAATIVDFLFASLAVIGIGPMLDRPQTKRIMRYFGVVILTYFGLGIILTEFGIGIIPGLGISSAAATSNAFWAGIVLTAANPLTILFWAGVFSSKISEGGINTKDIILFAAGAVSTTFVFLGILIIVAGYLHPFFTARVVLVMNILVGIALLAFAARMMLDRKPRTIPRIAAEDI